MSKKLIFLVILLLLLGIPVSGQWVDTDWIARYDFGNGDDRANAIFVDVSGDIYVTGHTEGVVTDSNYTTIKYHSNGDIAWVQTYNYSSEDVASAMVLDAPGNIYVTGFSYDGNAGNIRLFAYATIKYYPSGDTAWVRRHRYGKAWSIAVDEFECVYVTGAGNAGSPGSFYTTIKYYPNGDTAWVRNYYGGPVGGFDKATSIAVDASGNVYVTGYCAWSSGNYDYTTVKYYDNGEMAWVRRYHGPVNGDDRACAVATDASGNVYVTGQSFGIKIIPFEVTWIDYATIKYYPNGDTAWVRRYHGTGESDDIATAMVVDDSGNVYVTGYSWGEDIYGGETYWDYATIKYYPDGDTAWVRRYNARPNFDDRATTIAVDDSGGVYVTGCSGGDYATIKYRPDGNASWITRYDGQGLFDGDDWPTALAVNTLGDVYVTGYSRGTTGDYDFATIKYAQTSTGVAEESDATVKLGQFSLSQNYPNPFNRECVIEYALPRDCNVKLSVHNILGQKVKVFFDEYQHAGKGLVKWDGRDDQGQEVASGIYFYRLNAGGLTETKKMLLLQ